MHPNYECYLFIGVTQKEKPSQWPVKHIKMSARFVSNTGILIEKQKYLFLRVFFIRKALVTVVPEIQSLNRPWTTVESS